MVEVDPDPRPSDSGEVPRVVLPASAVDPDLDEEAVGDTDGLEDELDDAILAMLRSDLALDILERALVPLSPPFRSIPSSFSFLSATPRTLRFVEANTREHSLSSSQRSEASCSIDSMMALISRGPFLRDGFFGMSPLLLQPVIRDEDDLAVFA